jgi:hypothetical protein
MDPIKKIDRWLATPSTGNWDRLCQLLEEESAPWWKTAMERAEQGLGSWPEDSEVGYVWPIPFRRVQDRWASALCQGKPVPAAWSLARFLQYHDRSVSESEFHRVITSPALVGITHLYFYDNKLGESAMEELIASTVVPSVAHLVWAANGVDMGRLVRSDFVAQLKMIDISRTTFSKEDYEALARSDRLEGLESLTVGAPEKVSHVELLARSPHLKSLVCLDFGLAGLADATYKWFDEHAVSERMRRAAYAGKICNFGVRDLKPLCREAAIRGYSKMRRRQLISALLLKWDNDLCADIIRAHSEQDPGAVEILWRSWHGGHVHFLGRLAGGYCLRTYVNEEPIWFEGDRDNALAHLPQPLFEEAVASG